MLEFEELKRIAGIKNLSMKNAEKDYLQDIILFNLYRKFKSELVFKGGTCLYKAFGLNRFSEDLDFTYVENRDIQNIIEKVVNDIELLNIKANIKEIKSYRNEMNVRILLNGPLYKGGKSTQCFIPLNISMKEKVCLDPLKKKINSVYTEIPSFDIFIMSDIEIVAEKVRAILTRDKPRDIFDLYFLLIHKKVILDYVLIEKKLSLYDLKFTKKEFEENLYRKKNMWDSDLRDFVMDTVPEFEEVCREIMEKFG